MFLFWHGCRTRGGPHDAMAPSGDASAHLGTFLRVSPPAESATALGVTFWVPTHAPKYLVTFFESVSAFLLYSAPGCPGRDFPLESYLPHGRLCTMEHFTSQVALHWYYYYGLEATFSFSLSLPRAIGTWALPTASLPPWSFLPMGIGEPHRDCLASALFDLATPWLGDALPWRRFLLASLHLGDALGWLWLSSRWLWLWLSQRPGYGTVQLSMSLTLSC